MSFISSLFGGGSKAAKQQYEASNKQITDLLAQNKATSSFLQSTGSPLITQGAQTLQAPLDYYNKLFSGDRATSSFALGPALDTQKMNQQTMLQNVNKFAPRGGARTATVASSDTARDAQLTKLLQGLKPASADALTSVGLNLANLGSSVVGGGSNINSTSLSALLNQANLANTRQQQSSQNAMNTLTGIAQMIGYFI